MDGVHRLGILEKHDTQRDIKRYHNTTHVFFSFQPQNASLYHLPGIIHLQCSAVHRTERGKLTIFCARLISPTGDVVLLPDRNPCKDATKLLTAKFKRLQWKPFKCLALYPIIIIFVLISCVSSSSSFLNLFHSVVLWYMTMERKKIAKKGSLQEQQIIKMNFFALHFYICQWLILPHKIWKHANRRNIIPSCIC